MRDVAEGRFNIVGANLLYCTAEQRAVDRKDCGRALSLIECDDEDVDWMPVSCLCSLVLVLGAADCCG